MAKRVKKPTTKKPLGKKRVTKPRAKPAIKAGSKKKTTKKKTARKAQSDYKIIKPRRTATKEYLLEHYFARRGKKPPVRYRRAVPKGMVKMHVKLANKKLNTGYLVEFKYGYKQKPGQVGGWKNDPRPVIFLFHDDKIKYIQGVNTNYLSEWYLKKVCQIMKRFPGVDGEQIYLIFKRTAKFALKKGYRKYMRDSFRDVYLYVYENDIQRTIDQLAKAKQSKLGTANRAKNPEM